MDNDKFNNLLKKYNRLLNKITLSFYKKWGNRFSKEDLYHWVLTGFYDSCLRYDSTKGNFGNYAKIRTVGYVKDIILIETDYSHKKKYKEIIEHIKDNKSFDYISENFKVSKKVIMKAIDMYFENKICSNDIIDYKYNPENIYYKKKIYDDISSIIKDFNYKYKTIANLYFFYDWSLVSISQLLGITDAYVCMMVKEIKTCIKEKLILTGYDLNDFS